MDSLDLRFHRLPLSQAARRLDTVWPIGNVLHRSPLGFGVGGANPRLGFEAFEKVHYKIILIGAGQVVVAGDSDRAVPASLYAGPAKAALGKIEPIRSHRLALRSLISARGDRRLQSLQTKHFGLPVPESHTSSMWPRNRAGIFKVSYG